MRTIFRREGATKSAGAAVVGAYEWCEWSGSWPGRCGLDGEPTDRLIGHGYCLLASEHNRKQIKLLLPIMHTSLCTHGNGNHHLHLPLPFAHFALIFQAKTAKWQNSWHEVLPQAVCVKYATTAWKNMKAVAQDSVGFSWKAARTHSGKCIFACGGAWTRKNTKTGQHIWQKSWKNWKLAAKCCGTT